MCQQSWEHLEKSNMPPKIEESAVKEKKLAAMLNQSLIHSHLSVIVTLGVPQAVLFKLCVLV